MHVEYYFHTMSWFLFICALVIAGKTLSTNELTREVGENVMFMANDTAMEEASFGVRDGNTDYLNPKLFKALHLNGQSSLFPDSQLNSTSYAGRVSFVGDLSKGQAWFKITNLIVNDTNQYLVKILLMENQSSYISIPIRLNVAPVRTTVASTTSSTSTGIIITHGPSTHTAPPTNPPTVLKNLTVTIEVDKEFLPNMTVNTSSAFKKFVNEFQNEIKKAYTDEKKFESVMVVHLRKGSILVKFIVFFKSEISRENACAPLENAIKDGKLGRLKIVPGSLKCSKPMPASSPGPPGARTGLHPGIIAGVAVVGVLAIAGLIIAILFVCRKKSSKKDYRSSTGGEGYEMDEIPGGPEEQYASVQRPATSGTKQTHNQQIPQYAAVNKSKKAKKEPSREPGELVYAELDHGRNASVGTKQPSDGRPISGSDTVYADIQSDRQKKRYPPPQYGNMHDMSYA